MRTDIEFKTEDGTTLRGWHYVPDTGKGKYPTIMMCHGFSAVKEFYLDRFGEHFAANGFAAVIHDHRNFGASDGKLRLEIDPWQQVRDWRDAITFAETLPQTDTDRIGLWGTSYSGSHGIVVGAIDRRIKCVSVQVPLISGWSNARRLIRADFIGGFQQGFDADRRARLRGEAPAMVPVVAENPLDPAALPTPDSYAFCMDTSKRAPAWRNEVTLRSVEMFMEYEPGAYLPLVAPTPIQMIVATGDVLTVADQALAGYETALHPKRLICLKGGHFDAYVKDFDKAAGAATAWFKEHL
ncbi:MAG: alpha/beta hydrolase [Hyphomicrobiaceae bacterium]